MGCLGLDEKMTALGAVHTGIQQRGYKPYQLVQQRLLKGKINRLEVELEPVE